MNYGGLYEGEYAERCGHKNADDPTTLQEQADYAQYIIEQRIKIARSIFGNAIFIGGEGTYQVINDADRYGIYTSSSGRTYTEWKQYTGNAYGKLPMYTAGKVMGNYGCNVYCYTMLLNSVGLDLNPGDVHQYYRYGNSGDSTSGTLNHFLEENGISGKPVKIYNDVQKYISALLSGSGVMSWVGPNSGYTSKYHWVVAADIRPSQLGSTYGYDVYVLSSTHRSGAEYGWQPIEKIVDNLQSRGYYGWYIAQ